MKNTNYEFSVQAKDSSGNTSLRSSVETSKLAPEIIETVFRRLLEYNGNLQRFHVIS